MGELYVLVVADVASGNVKPGTKNLHVAVRFGGGSGVIPATYCAILAASFDETAPLFDTSAVIF